MAGYLVLGMGFGMMLEAAGYGIGWALAMSIFIYAGSMQYVVIDLLTGGASLITTALMTVAVNIRHLFYGISMVERYQNTRPCKPYLIFALTDETYWGAYFSLIGCAVILGLNIWLVPTYGYVASAWASVAGYGVITLLSYFIGQKKYPVAYPLKRMTLYLVLALVLYVLSQETLIANLWLRLSYRTLLILVFVAFIIKKDLPLRSLPFVNRFFK